MKKILYFIIAFICMTSCIGGLGFVIEEKILDNYYLIATDTIEDLALSYHESNDRDNYSAVIEATVFAIGYDGKFMIVKQHPFANRSITNYFILPIKQGMNWRSKNGLIGPLTLEQFKEKRKKIGIENLEFTKVYKELE